MMDIKNTQISGDLSVSRNANIGGTVVVRGNLSADHNIEVKGWLEAKNLRGALKGLFADEASLKARYPHPMQGWGALVLSEEQASGPAAYSVYHVPVDEWINSGKTVNIEVANQVYEQQVEGLLNRISTAETNIDSLDEEIDELNTWKEHAEATDGAVMAISVADTCALPVQTMGYSGNGSDPGVQVVWVKDVKEFYLISGTSRYNAWRDYLKYGTPQSGLHGLKPHIGKMYINGEELYVSTDGVDLELSNANFINAFEEVTAAANTANANSTQALADSAQAKEDASAAISKSAAAETAANAAVTTANEAKADAAQAKTDATQAKAEASTALTKSNSAETAANTATAAVEDMSSRLTTVETKAGDNATAITELSGKVNEQEELIGGLDDWTSELTNRTAAAETAANTATAAVDGFGSRLGDLESFESRMSQCIGEILVSELDDISVPGDLTGGGLYRVKNNSGQTVGWLMKWPCEPSAQRINQTLFTSMLLDDAGELTPGAHKDHMLYVYRRMYNYENVQRTEPIYGLISARTWSKWVEALVTSAEKDEIRGQLNDLETRTTAFISSKNKSGGIAGLDSNGKINVRNIPGSVQGAVLEIGVTESSPLTVQTMSYNGNGTDAGAQVVWISQEKVLCLIAGMRRYKSWADWEKYGTMSKDGLKPYSGKLYVSGDEMYISADGDDLTLLNEGIAGAVAFQGRTLGEICLDQFDDIDADEDGNKIMRVLDTEGYCCGVLLNSRMPHNDKDTLQQIFITNLEYIDGVGLDVNADRDFAINVLQRFKNLSDTTISLRYGRKVGPGRWLSWQLIGGSGAYRRLWLAENTISNLQEKVTGAQSSLTELTGRVDNCEQWQANLERGTLTEMAIKQIETEARIERDYAEVDAQMAKDCGVFYVNDNKYTNGVELDGMSKNDACGRVRTWMENYPGDNFLEFNGYVVYKDEENTLRLLQYVEAEPDGVYEGTFDDVDKARLPLSYISRYYESKVAALQEQVAALAAQVAALTGGEQADEENTEDPNA